MSYMYYSGEDVFMREIEKKLKMEDGELRMESGRIKGKSS